MEFFNSRILHSYLYFTKYQKYSLIDYTSKLISELYFTNVIYYKYIDINT